MNLIPLPVSLTQRDSWICSLSTATPNLCWTPSTALHLHCLHLSSHCPLLPQPPPPPSPPPCPTLPRPAPRRPGPQQQPSFFLIFQNSAFHSSGPFSPRNHSFIHATKTYWLQMATLCQTLGTFFGIHFSSICFPPVPTPFASTKQNLFWLLKQSFVLSWPSYKWVFSWNILPPLLWLAQLYSSSRKLSLPLCPTPQVQFGILFMCFP